MTYHISKKVASAFAETVTTVKTKLAEHGFGILSEINVTSKLQEKLGVSFRHYQPAIRPMPTKRYRPNRISGPCSPAMS